MSFKFDDKNQRGDGSEKAQGTVVIRGTPEGLLFVFDRVDSENKDKILLSIQPEILEYFVNTVTKEAIRAQHGIRIEENFKGYIADFTSQNKTLKDVDVSEETDTYKLLRNFYVEGAISDGSLKSFLDTLVPLQEGLDSSHLTMAELMAFYNAGYRETGFEYEEYEEHDEDESSDEDQEHNFGN